jgi:predicted ribosomally synthesized peptide with nif11-like leader
MSAEAVQAFIDAVKADAGLQEKLKAVADAVNADEAIVRLGSEAGFDFTAEEWLDEHLEGVVGGSANWWVAASTEDSNGGQYGTGGFL